MTDFEKVGYLAFFSGTERYWEQLTPEKSTNFKWELPVDAEQLSNMLKM